MDSNLTSKEKEKLVVLDAFFVPVFNIDDRSWAAQTSELEDCDWRSSDFPSMVPKLYQLNTQKSMGPEGIHS